MIDLYYWPTPNGYKITILLEELALPYRVIPIDIAAGDQHQDSFLAINPNGKIPAIVDHGAPGAPSVFESGAILLHLAERTGRLVPVDPDARRQCLEWLFWQMGGLGPMAGQLHHFRLYAPLTIDYAVARYTRETRRLYGVLDAQLARTGDCVAGAYSIADIACLPWIYRHERQGIALADFPHVQAWYDKLMARPAVVRGFAVGTALRDEAAMRSQTAQEHLFNNR